MQLGYEIDEAYENEFIQKCEEIAMYQSHERTTLDREWTESELKDDIYDVCIEVMTDSELKKYENKALYNRDLLKVQYMADSIYSEIEDVIELYNKEYDKHRNENKFGITWYDEAIRNVVMKKLRGNVVK